MDTFASTLARIPPIRAVCPYHREVKRDSLFLRLLLLPNHSADGISRLRFVLRGTQSTHLRIEFQMRPLTQLNNLVSIFMRFEWMGISVILVRTLSK